jgi:hypothetical protein
MDNRKWFCAVCLIPNLPTAAACRNCKTSREVTADTLQAHYDTVDSKAGWLFQAGFLLLGLLVAYVSHADLWFRAAIVLVSWWGGLVFLACQPACGHFRLERRYFQHLIASVQTEWGRRCIGLCLRLLYWPIFISKGTYLLLLLGAFLIYLAATWR